MTKLKRDELIKMVSDCILNDRQNTYGSPEDNFNTIADLWNEYLTNEHVCLDAYNVAMMMALLKYARIKSSPNHIDNYVDLAGYILIAGSLVNANTKK